ncbi:MAG: T9SS type A sorting domain-containing protein [Saprospiraceae bacterium]|nr:T9SS type A sorting domain-containing protein [Saprospiraceae bacterium]MBK7219974.1 T9SS type A sorting domain-containing protein [Saprospiraceae bacterium]MBK9687186.1 T9SS type A sorting domain-containing protein [Saprospiraceae bacterium]
MKQIYFFLLFMLSTLWVSAQASFSDDFESYTVGEYLGPQSDKWTTWSVKDGTTEDTKITNAKAASGTKSIYFSSTSASGGPQDVVLPFTDAYTSGVYKIGMKLFIEDGKTGYFNLQAEKVIGTTWAIDVNFNTDGTVVLTGGGSTLASGKYPQGEWFAFEIAGNISANLWATSVNGGSLGTFTLASNKVASIDIYPANANASFYVDDFYYSQDVFTPKPNDIGISGVTVAPRDLTGIKSPLGVNITNLGASTVNDMEIEFQYGSLSGKKTVTGLNLASLGSKSILFDEEITVLAGANPIQVSAKLIGATDDDAANNASASSTTGVTPAADKFVIAEEATGTWCGWCPRGAVMLDRLSKRYPDYFIGIAVHNADPMVVTDYDAGIRGLSGFTGFPSATVGRTAIIDPLAIETAFFSRVIEAPKSSVRVGASFDETSRVIKLSPKITFKANVSGSYKMAVVIVEDSVRGTATGYAQANYYSGGAQGPMGGYELLPNPVPANKMTYNHVARVLTGGFKGTALPLNSYKKDDVVYMNFEATIPAGVKLENIHIIPILFAPSGLIDNGYPAKLEEALAEGFTVGANDITFNGDVVIYPNPVAFESIIDLTLDNPAEVSVEIYDMTGKLVGSKNYGKLSGSNELLLNASNLNNGTYLARIKAGAEEITKNIVVLK